METPFIQADGFYLRELRETDLQGNWHAWFNDSVVTRYQNKKILPNTRERQRAFYDGLKNSQSDVVLAMVDQATNKHFGNVGLHRIDWVHRSAELGIVIGEKEYWGRKFGRQAWSLITAYGFETLNLHRIYAWVMAANTASAKCAEAAGFKAEGRVRDMFYKNGGYEDAVYYNLLVDDLKT